MALSKRNSNAITVDGTAYRWTVAARSQSDTHRVTVVVQPPNDGQRLAIEVPCRDPYLNIGDPKPKCDIRAVTPRFVRQLIENAQSIGWMPTMPKRQFDVSCVFATPREDDGHNGATCHVCWQCPVCNEWYSDDVEFGESPPMMTKCGRTKHHTNGTGSNVILFWYGS